MAISIFPSTAAEFVSNNFVVDMNDTTNNTADTGGVKQAGPYSISFSSGDSSFDVYFVDEDGNSVGYSNNTSIVASGLFTTVVIFGVAQDEVISFLYQGSVNNADGEGDEPGAGAYLESISPSDLPTIDDTATVTGGNFGADTEIYFDSGQTSLEAKNITVNNSTELIVTRPDNLDAALDPWTLRAVTTGVPEPTGTNANLLVDGVTAGAVPSWVTTSPLSSGTVDTVYGGATLEATDPDGGAVTYSIVSGTLPTGLSLDSSTGVISGTPTAGSQTFTAGATDEGGNTTTREFTLPIQLATGGTVTTDGGFIYHTFTASDDFEALAEISNVDYFVIAGGGGAGGNVGGGGGAGGLLQGTATTVTAGTHTITVGAGGNGADVQGDPGSNGSNSTFGTFGTGIGGGGGGVRSNGGLSGGSGGGAGRDTTASGGAGTAGQGFPGGAGNNSNFAAGGGGAGEAGNTDGYGAGGDGLLLSEVATATSTGVDGGHYAGGGAGGSGQSGEFRSGGLGGGGDTEENAVANTGGGAGGGANAPSPNGGSGIVIVRYA